MRRAQTHIQPICRAGLPTTSAKSGTARITTAPAPMKAYRPMVTPQTIVALAPMVALFRIRVSTRESADFLIYARGFGSLVSTQLGPRETLSSTVTHVHK